MSFSLADIFPPNTRVVSIAIGSHMGNEPVESDVNIWLWTECDGGIQDVKYKRLYRSKSDLTVSYDSETFNFVYCSSHPHILLLCDIMRRQANIWLDLYAVGYSTI